MAPRQKYFQQLFFFIFTYLVNQNGVTVIYFISKDGFFTHTFTNNLTLDDNGVASPSPPPPDYIMPGIKHLRMDVFYVLHIFDPWKVYVTDGIPSSLNYCLVLALCMVKVFCLCLSTSIIPSCW